MPITPEIIAEADKRALADPLTDAELAAVAAEESALFAVESGLSPSEKAKLQDELKSGKLTAWVNGKKLEAPKSGKSTVSPDAASPDAISTMAVYQPTTWGACGVSDASSKHVRTFYINTVPYAYRAVSLQCGTDGWGYRHIKLRHQADWEGKAWYVGANWRDMADFSITDALQHIYSGTYNASNNTYKYRGVVELRRYNGQTVHTFYPHVVVSAGDYRIITAYPSSTR